MQKEERKEENILEDENKVETEDGQPALNKKVSKSRQSEAGLLLRRKNNKEKNLTIKAVKESSQSLEHKYEEMKTTLKETELEKIKLQTELNKKDNEIAAMKTKMKENDQYLKNTFKYMSKAGKAEFKNSYQLGKLEHPKGTTLRLLRNTGINMSKTILTPDQKKSELKTEIDKFAKENSSESPDMRNEKKGIRYRHKYLSTLYDDFKYENPDIEVSMAVFCSYWPKNIVKPKPGDYALCACEKCENPSLKLRALKRHKLIKPEHDIETILRNSREEDFVSEEDLKEDLKALLEEPKASESVSYLVWEKVKTVEVNKNTGKTKQATTQRVPKTAKAKDLALETLADVEILKEHLERNNIIKKKVMEKREEAVQYDNKVMLQVDWAENGVIITPDEAQSAFYGGRTNYSLHTGYQYSKENSGGFASLSDENDHKAEAIHAALDPKIKQLAEKGIKEITIVSDSPTSQYRNGKNAYLTSRLAEENKIKIFWIFREAGHGKSAADGIGGNIKNAAQNKQTMDANTVINSAADVKEQIETTIEISIHTKEDIDKVKKSMPQKVGALVGATRIHELSFEPDGTIKKKDLPNEVFYKQVKIKEGRIMQKKQKETPTEDFMEEQETLDETAENENRDDVTGLHENDMEARERKKRRRNGRRQATLDSIYAEMEVDTDTGSEDEF